VAARRLPQVGLGMGFGELITQAAEPIFYLGKKAILIRLRGLVPGVVCWVMGRAKREGLWMVAVRVAGFLQGGLVRLAVVALALCAGGCGLEATVAECGAWDDAGVLSGFSKTACVDSAPCSVWLGAVPGRAVTNVAWAADWAMLAASIPAVADSVCRNPEAPVCDGAALIGNRGAAVSRCRLQPDARAAPGVRAPAFSPGGGGRERQTSFEIAFAVTTYSDGANIGSIRRKEIQVRPVQSQIDRQTGLGFGGWLRTSGPLCWLGVWALR